MNTNLMKVTIVILLLFHSASGQVFKSNVSKKGTTAAPFLSIGQGARALSMGSAFVAVADDPSALFWNPAGLTDMEGGAIIVDHTEWFAGLQYNYLAGALHLGDGNVMGLSFTASNIDEMNVTTVDEPNGTGETFKVTDIAVSVAYAMQLTDNFSIGFNPKFVYQSIWKMNATALAIDVGVKYVTPFDGIVLGMAISNFGTKMKMQGNSSFVFYDPDLSTSGNNGRIPANLLTEEWSLPLNFKFGIAYTAYSDEMNSFVVAADASHPSDNYESVDLGAEYIFSDFVALRGGFKSMFLAESEEGMTLGIGIKQSMIGATRISFDYAYQDFGRLKNVQKFSLSLLF